MQKKPKLSAEKRTIEMFAVKPPYEEPPEPVEEHARGERIPVEQDVDRLREQAFTCQEWTSKYFAQNDSPSNEYRVTRKGGHYYVETIAKTPGGREAYGYVGIMVRECDLENLTKVLVQAVRARQAETAKAGVPNV